MDTKMIQNLLYTMSYEDVKNSLTACSDNTVLHLYAFNYNWNNGFDLPQTIVDNPACSLSTALMIFYLADGYRFLTERTESSEIPEWLSFISRLYYRIHTDSFVASSIAFSVPLSKVQIFKLKKQLKEYEQCFVTNIEGENYDISV